MMSDYLNNVPDKGVLGTITGTPKPIATENLETTTPSSTDKIISIGEAPLSPVTETGETTFSYKTTTSDTEYLLPKKVIVRKYTLKK